MLASASSVRAFFAADDDASISRSPPPSDGWLFGAAAVSPEVMKPEGASSSVRAA